MKNIKYIVGIFLTLVFFTSCEEENYKFGDIIAPSNVEVVTEIVGQNLADPLLLDGDGTGFVTFETTADNVISYTYSFGDGSTVVAPTGKVTHRYTKVGVNTFTVTVNAIGTGGVASTVSVDVKVYSSFSDEEAEDFLSGGILGKGKKWYWAADLDVHVGMGPANDNYGDLEFSWPQWWSGIKAWDTEKSCMYSDEFVFTKTADGITFEQTEGTAFIPGTYAGYIGVDGDQCHGAGIATTMLGVKKVSLFPSDSKAALEGSFKDIPNGNARYAYRKTAFEIADGGFMGWYVGASTYDIISVTKDILIVRIVENPATGSGAAWYHVFKSTKPVQQEEAFSKLVWSDEFNTAGAPNAATWTYDLGAGGWGNGEAQTYTNSADNVIVADGVLKITAKKDGTSYTSARLKTQGLKDFGYGRLDVYAKLPAAQGSWPAIWMLGSNFDTVNWPKCGEIDIMEQTGANKNETLGTLHWYNTAGLAKASYGKTTAITNVSSQFHLYSLERTKESIKIFVDDVKFFEMTNDATLPFYDKDFFMILNVAMGGSLGGTIDGAFTEASMEIDYVRFYQ